MILIRRVKNPINQRNTIHTLSVCAIPASNGEGRFIEEVRFYEKFENQPCLANFAGDGAGHLAGQLSALSQ
ncbi:hypothetical protein D3C72_894630 [compost metagenome]